MFKFIFFFQLFCFSNHLFIVVNCLSIFPIFPSKKQPLITYLWDGQCLNFFLCLIFHSSRPIAYHRFFLNTDLATINSKVLVIFLTH